jgi:hypothetical protein
LLLTLLSSFVTQAALMIAAAVLGLLFLEVAAGYLRFSQTLGSSMVLQREPYSACVFGQADPYIQLTVKVDGAEEATLMSHWLTGEFRQCLRPRPAGGPHEASRPTSSQIDARCHPFGAANCAYLSVLCRQIEVTNAVNESDILKDVMFGEVWPLVPPIRVPAVVYEAKTCIPGSGRRYLMSILFTCGVLTLSCPVSGVDVRGAE